MSCLRNRRPREIPQLLNFTHQPASCTLTHASRNWVHLGYIWQQIWQQLATVPLFAEIRSLFVFEFKRSFLVHKIGNSRLWCCQICAPGALYHCAIPTETRSASVRVFARHFQVSPITTDHVSDNGVWISISMPYDCPLKEVVEELSPHWLDVTNVHWYNDDAATSNR